MSADNPTGRTPAMGPIPAHIHALGSEARGAWEHASTEDILADLNFLANVATGRARETFMPADQARRLGYTIGLDQQRVTWRAKPVQAPDGSTHEVWYGKVGGVERFEVSLRACEGRREPLARLFSWESGGRPGWEGTDPVPVGEFLHLEGAKNRARRVLRLGVEASIVRAPAA